MQGSLRDLSKGTLPAVSCMLCTHCDDITDAPHSSMQHLIGLQEGLCEGGAVVIQVCTTMKVPARQQRHIRQQ